MKYNCEIEIKGVKSKKSFIDEIFIMLNDYCDMNEDAKEIFIVVKDKIKENKSAD